MALHAEQGDRGVMGGFRVQGKDQGFDEAKWGSDHDIQRMPREYAKSVGFVILPKERSLAQLLKGLTPAAPMRNSISRENKINRAVPRKHRGALS
jgi:hypothetical protein